MTKKQPRTHRATPVICRPPVDSAPQNEAAPPASSPSNPPVPEKVLLVECAVAFEPTEAVTVPVAAQYARTSGQWNVLEEAVVGFSHRAKNLPCQDAARALAQPRPTVVVADGAGSSLVSEIGAQAVVIGVTRILDTLGKPLGELLDQDTSDPQVMAKAWGLLLVKHAMGLLKDLAQEHRRPVRDFRSTLLIMVSGQKRLLWLKVGDGALVVEKMKQLSSTEQDSSSFLQSELTVLGNAGKGEFANQTQFLDMLNPDDVQIGCIDATEITGMAAMSDGAAERLVSNDGQQVAARLSTLLAQLRCDQLVRQHLTQMFYDASFCQGTTGDDRSIALAAAQVAPTSLADPIAIAPQSTQPKRQHQTPADFL